MSMPALALNHSAISCAGVPTPGARADHAAGAEPVLDHDGGAEDRPHGVGDQSRDHVGRPARRERHDDADRRGGKSLRCRGCRHPEQRRRGDRRLLA
jgi:hypothetical protein